MSPGTATLLLDLVLLLSSSESESESQFPMSSILIGLRRVLPVVAAFQSSVRPVRSRAVQGRSRAMAGQLRAGNVPLRTHLVTLGERVAACSNSGECPKILVDGSINRQWYPLWIPHLGGPGS